MRTRLFILFILLLLLPVFSSEKTGLDNQLIFLDGSRSSDENGEKLIYRWRQIGGKKVELQNAESARPGFLPAESGVYAFELVVSNGQAISQPAVVEIDVEIEKLISIPTARINAPQKAIVKPAPKNPAPPENVAPIITAEKATEKIEAVRAPQIRVEQTNNATAKVKTISAMHTQINEPIALKALNNTAPIASIKNNINAEVGERVILEGYGVDSDGDKLTYQWRQTGGAPLNNVKTNGKDIVFIADNDGVYLFELFVNDGNVNSPPAECAVTVIGRDTILINNR